jgi:hypothetical protein
MILMERAMRNGSFVSTGSGFPVFTLQNLHALVQISPSIMNVAVPLAPHSAALGHLPLVQMVCRWFSFTTLFIHLYSSVPGSFILSQSGFETFLLIFTIYVKLLSEIQAILLKIIGRGNRKKRCGAFTQEQKY